MTSIVKISQNLTFDRFAVRLSTIMSAFIIENKADYYYLLNNVTTLKSWREWILYMLKAIEETSIYTIKKIMEIDNLFQRTNDLILQKLPHIHKETVEKIFEQPYISPKKLLSHDIRSLNTAKKYLITRAVVPAASIRQQSSIY
jgi:Fic family protein